MCRGLHFIFCFVFRLRTIRGGIFFAVFRKKVLRIQMCVVYLWKQKEEKKMTTVTFFLPITIETGHPNFEEQARWLGRAIITQETDWDDDEQPFSVDVAEVTDLFYLPYAGADISTARRVELPDNSKDGYTFRYRLQQAAITAYHNPQLQPVEMPDEPETIRL